MYQLVTRILLYFFIISGTLLSAQDSSSIDSIQSLISTPDRHDTLKILDHLATAKIYYHIDRDSSKFYNEKARDWSIKVKFNRGLARAQTNLSLLLINDNKPVEAEKLLNEALVILKNISDPEIELFINSNLGILNHYGADYEKAVDHYLRSAEIARSLDDDYEEARALINIGDVFNQNGITDKAIDFIKRARNLSTQKHPILFAYSSILLSDFYKNEQDSAWYYVNSSFDVVDQISSPQILYNMYTGRATILENELKYEKAYPDYIQALSHAKELGQSYAVAGCYCLLGNNANNRDSYNEAENYFLEYDKLREEVNNDHLDKECYQYWSLMEEARGNYKKSNELLYKYFEIKDSIFSQENRTILSDLEIKYESANKDAEIATQQLQLSQRTAQRNLFILGAGGLLLLTWFLFYRNQKNNILATTKIDNLEKHQKLMALDYMVQGQEEERKRIARDLHDGLGGLLTSVRHQIHSIQQQISSLSKVDIAGNAEKMITQACNEVRRISHDMMPASLVSLGLVDTVEDLVRDIKEQYNLNVSFDSLGRFDDLSDKVKVNLYRIIQEVTNNTIKHADANAIFISLSREANNLTLRISDDGKGFDYEAAKGKDGIGLKSIASRVKYLEGIMDVESVKDKGTVFRVELQVNEIANL